ncbi:MAG: signal peptidase I [Chitinophagaceae bacterium]|nr:MAG: signal peptidase I [Chitinophagaceae bacterium]
MSFHDLSVLILISLLLLLLPAPGIALMFKKAGIPSWKAWVPFYNTWEMHKATGLSKHWFYWQFIPVVGWFITLWIYVEWVKLFGKFNLWEHAATVFVPFLYFPYVGANKDDRFLGRDVVKKHKKGAAREWIDAAVFAIVAATLIRTFVFEAYVIPTGSMEKTLLVNDFLFVSKLTYGPRIPNTPLAIPFVHHTLPVVNSKSYTEIVKIPYTRWFEKPVDRNDVVVFNFPAGDTLTKEYDSRITYYDLVRAYGRDNVWENYQVVTRPVDKRENYIKRCVAIAGDTLSIKDGVLFVNGEPAFVSPTQSTYYNVITNNVRLDVDMLRESGIRLNNDINPDESQDFVDRQNYNYLINLTAPELDIIKKIPGTKVTKDINDTHGDLYPNDTANFKWSLDNFGPLWVPKKGAKIQLNAANIALYKRAIQVYENNTWEERDGKIYLNGEPAAEYTFKMDYFWMMGDNRHKSQDSRFWGFVPEDHVVGGAWLIWMSWEKGPRWNRIFKRIH